MSKEHPLRQKIARALEHLETSARAFTVAGNAILSMSDSIQKDGIWGAMQPAQSNSPATASLQQPVPLRKERSTSRKVVEKRTLLHMHLQTAIQPCNLEMWVLSSGCPANWMNLRLSPAARHVLRLRVHLCRASDSLQRAMQCHGTMRYPIILFHWFQRWRSRPSGAAYCAGISNA